MINHCFQGAHDIQAHRADHGKYGDAFAVKFLEFIKNSINQTEQKVLILGCGDGKNDLLPILEILTPEATSIKIRFDCFDDSESLLGMLINDLSGKAFNKNAEEIWEKGNIKIKLKCMDIENSNFFSEIKSNNYNWVIAFCVLHHLTNWQSVLLQLNDNNILSDDGSIFILTVEYPYFYILENYYDKNINDSILKQYPGSPLIKFSEILYKIKHVDNHSLCCCSASGVDITPFVQFLNGFFSIDEILSLRKVSKWTIDKEFLLKAVQSEPPQHTMLFWGTNSTLKSDFSETFDSNIKNRLIQEINKIDGNYEHESTLHIYQFKKNKNGRQYYQKGTTYGITERFIEDFIKFPVEEREESSIKEKNKINNLLFLQILLSRQGLTRDDTFISINLYPIGLDANGHVYVKTASPSSTFYSLHSSRKDDQQSFLNYIWAHSFFRVNAMSKKYDPSHFSVAKAILKVNKKMIWVFSSSQQEEITIEKKNEFVHIKIPNTYVQEKDYKVFQGLLLKHIFPINVIRYNNYFAISFEEVINKIFSPDNIKSFKNILNKEKILNVHKISIDREKIKTGFKSIGFETNLEELADSIPLISTLTINFSNIIYIPNTVFESPYIASGGILIGWKKNAIEKLDGSSFLSRKIYFLQKLMDKFTQKALQPELGSHFVNLAKNVRTQAIKAALGAIMSRNMSHNIGSHVIADLVSQGPGEANTGELNAFYRYLQNRMDFIAQITTEFPEWTYPAYFQKELMKAFYESYILIDRIGVSEGLSAYDWPNDNDWRQGDMRGKIIVRTCITGWENGVEIKDKFFWGVNEYHMGNLVNDLQLAIPGGIVGYHALYIIIENIVRNSAKHDYDSRMDNCLNSADGIIKDKIVVIRYEDINKCKYWIISKDSKDVEIDADLLKKKMNECRTIIIESTCLKVEKKENSDGDFDFIWEVENSTGFIIKLIDESLLTFKIDIEGRLFIACMADLHKEKCYHNIKKEMSNNCLMVDENYWQDKKPYYQVITDKEFKKLKEDYQIPPKEALTLTPEAQKERYDNIINFLQRGPLRINIRIDDMVDKDYVWVTIWDNMRHKPSIEFDKDNDIHKEVSVNISEDDLKKRVLKIPANLRSDEYELVNLFGYMNDRLRQSFIKETGELKKEDWGLAELKICAGFLQNRKIEEIGNPGPDIIQDGNNCFKIVKPFIIEEMDNLNQGFPRMIIKALPVDKKGQLFDIKIGGKPGKEDFYFLGFRFWMKKPKIVALAVTDSNLRDNRNGN